MNEKKWIVIMGDPVDGFAYFGPFPDADSAVEWGNTNGDSDWWITSLHDPELGDEVEVPEEIVK